MKKIFWIFLLFVTAVSFMNAQNAKEIVEKGTRYLFRNADGNINGYMVFEFNNKSMIFDITDVNFKVGVIQLMTFHTIYDNDSFYKIPEYWYHAHVGGYTISKVKDNIYTINWGKEYVTKFRAEGAWAAAVLDIYQ